MRTNLGPAFCANSRSLFVFLSNLLFPAFPVANKEVFRIKGMDQLIWILHFTNSEDHLLMYM